MAGQQQHTGLFRILLMVGGMVLLLSMFGKARSQHDELLVSRLSNAATVLMGCPDFEKAEASASGGVLLTCVDGTMKALEPSESLAVLVEEGTVRHTWKADGDVFFILGGVAEAHRGYVFSRDATLTMPGGIRSVERLEKPVTGYCCYAIATRP